MKHRLFPLLIFLLVLASSLILPPSSFAQNRSRVVCDELITGKVGFAATSWEDHADLDASLDWYPRTKGERNASLTLYLKVDSLTAATDPPCSLRVEVLYSVTGANGTTVLGGTPDDSLYYDLGAYGSAGLDSLKSPFMVTATTIIADSGFVWTVPWRNHGERKYRFWCNDTVKVTAVEREQYIE